MPFGLGLMELVLVALMIGAMVGLVHVVFRLSRGGRRRELDEVRRDFEREVEAMKRRERLPKS